MGDEQPGGDPPGDDPPRARGTNGHELHVRERSSEPDWLSVRDSWVGGERPSAPGRGPGHDDEPSPEAESNRPRTVPPPLPARGAARDPDASDSGPHVDDAVSLMLERLAASDYDGTWRVAKAILRREPGNSDAVQCAEIARGDLFRVYRARLGSAAAVPHLAVRAQRLATMGLDPRAGALLAFVNGHASIEEIASCGAMDKLEAMRLLSELYLTGVIALDR